MLNAVPAVSEVRQPRGVIKVNDEVMSGWIEWEVDNNTFYQADTFRAVFAVSLLPENRGADWWALQTEISVEVLSGFPADAENYSAAELNSKIYGYADEVVFNPVTRTIEVTGRDMTARLIDKITTKKWQRLSASTIAQQIAADSGLKYIGVTTTGEVGKYYDIEHVTLSDQLSEWDLLTWLAGMYQLVVYVAGRELHFEKPATKDDSAYVLDWQPPSVEVGNHSFNGKNISFSRNLAISKGVKVVVNSFNQRTGKVSATYPKKPAAKAQQYVRRYANLTNEQALQKAQELYKDIVKHELRLSAELPADEFLSVRNIITVSGTGTDFDQLYYPESIKRRMNMDEGYSMSVSAKNHSPESEVQA